MCGIGGIRKYGEEPIKEEMIRGLLVGLESRGNDSTGMAFMNTAGDVFVHKHDIAAWKYVSSDTYKTFITDHLSPDITQVILHTRAATKGTCRVNNNNHPLFHGKAAVIHNGGIGNDDELFRTLELERHAETDTDIIRAIIDKDGFTEDAVKNLNKMRGSAAIAVLSPDYPGKMMLGRSGSPIVLGSDENFFFFASEKAILHRAFRPWIQRFNIPFQKQAYDLGFQTMADNTVWILGEKGLERHAEMSTAYGNWKEPIRRIYTGWGDRQERNSTTVSDGPAAVTTLTAVPEKKELLINCPKCDKLLAIDATVSQYKYADLVCPTKTQGCGASLESAKPAKTFTKGKVN